MSSELMLQCLQELQGVLSPTTKLSLASIVRFVFLATNLKNDIILVQPGDYDPDSPPANLSPSMIHFLSASCQIVLEDVPAFWTAFKDTFGMSRTSGFTIHSLFSRSMGRNMVSVSPLLVILKPVKFMMLQPCLPSIHHTRHACLMAVPTRRSS